jgi:hypothetical protein
MYISDLGSKVGLLGACIMSNLGYIIKYDLGHVGSKVGLG